MDTNRQNNKEGETSPTKEIEIFDDADIIIDESSTPASSKVSSTTPNNDVEVFADEDIEVFDGKDYEGSYGAMMSSVNRLKAGAYQLVGDEEGAKTALIESQAYRPTVPSYKDIDSTSDLGSFIAENMSSGLPYLPVMVLGPKAALATGAGLTALDAGATYAEQDDDKKSMVRAVASAGANVALERVGLGKFAGSNPVIRTMAEAAEEGGRGAVAHLTAQVVGQGKSFEESMANIDEAIVAGAITRVAMKPVESAITKPVEAAGDYLAQPIEGTGVGDMRSNRQGLRSETLEANAVNQQYADLVAEGNEWQMDEPNERVQRQNRDEYNTILAAQRLNAAGGNLTTAALDFNINLRNGEVNVADEYFKVNKADRQAENVSKFLSERFNLPIVGDIISRRRQNWEKTDSARNNLYREFDGDIANINDTLARQRASFEEMEMNRPEGARRTFEHFHLSDEDKKGIMDYVNTGAVIPDTLASKLNSLPSTDGQTTLFDKVVQMKRINQMADNMRPDDGQGELTSVGAGAVEALAFGGVPILSTGGALIAQSAAAIMTRNSRKQIEDILLGNRKETKDGTITPAQREELARKIAELDSVLGRLGVGSDEDEEEKYADLKML